MPSKMSGIKRCPYFRGYCNGPPPRKILNLDPFMMQSGTRLLFNTCDKTIITILNFMISGGWENCGWGGVHLLNQSAAMDNLA